MKEKYNPLEIEVISFDDGNVVTSSPYWGEEFPDDDPNEG